MIFMEKEIPLKLHLKNHKIISDKGVSYTLAVFEDPSGKQYRYKVKGSHYLDVRSNAHQVKELLDKIEQGQYEIV